MSPQSHFAFVPLTKQASLLYCLIAEARVSVLTALFALPKTFFPLGFILTFARWTFAVAILVAAPLGTPLLALVDLALVATLVVAFTVTVVIPVAVVVAIIVAVTIVVATGREITSGEVGGCGHWDGLWLWLSSHGSQVLARRTGSDESKG
jgi:hypothetical protein